MSEDELQSAQLKRERKAEYDKVYRAENRERRNTVVREWKQRNRKRANELNRLSRARNPEASIASTRRWQRENAERFRATQKKNRIKNKESHKAWKAAWRKTEIGKTSVINSAHRRRILKAAAEKPATNAEMMAVKQAAKGRCHYCRKRAKLTFDHVIPLAKGGSHEITNLVMACGICNSSKGAKPPEQFAIEIGLLLI